MLESLNQFYDSYFVANGLNQILSIQVILSLSYLLACILSFVRALQSKEHFSNFVCILTFGCKYLLTSLIMEYALVGIINKYDIDIAQNVYLILALSNLVAIYVIFHIHKHFAFEIKPLALYIVKIMLVFFAANTVLWFKLVVFDIEEALGFIHYIYSTVVLLSSCLAAIVMLYPKILNVPKFGRLLNLRS